MQMARRECLKGDPKVGYLTRIRSERAQSLSARGRLTPSCRIQPGSLAGYSADAWRLPLNQAGGRCPRQSKGSGRASPLIRGGALAPTQEDAADFIREGFQS